MNWNEEPVFTDVSKLTTEEKQQWLARLLEMGVTLSPSQKEMLDVPLSLPEQIHMARTHHAFGDELTPEQQALVAEHGPMPDLNELDREEKRTWQADDLRDDL